MARVTTMAPYRKKLTMFAARTLETVNHRNNYRHRRRIVRQGSFASVAP